MVNNHSSCLVCLAALPENRFGIVCIECYHRLGFTINEDWEYTANDAGQRSAGVTGGAAAIMKVGDDPDIDYDQAVLPPYKHTEDAATKKTEKMINNYRNMNMASDTSMTQIMATFI